MLAVQLHAGLLVDMKTSSLTSKDSLTGAEQVPPQCSKKIETCCQLEDCIKRACKHSRTLFILSFLCELRTRVFITVTQSLMARVHSNAQEICISPDSSQMDEVHVEDEIRDRPVRWTMKPTEDVATMPARDPNVPQRPKT